MLNEGVIYFGSENSTKNYQLHDFNLPEFVVTITNEFEKIESLLSSVKGKNVFYNISYRYITKAIENVKMRLGEKGAKVTFIVSDVLDFVPTVQYDFWHDRACFHFLTEPEQIEKYADIVDKALSNSGRVFIGVFSEEGPKKCSGLDVKQYTMESLRLVFEKKFQLKGCFIEDHKTPFDTIQNFLFCGFKRKQLT